MFQAIRKHLTPSTAIAFVALVFALTGGAFAATGGGGNSGSPAKATASAASTKTTRAAATKSKAKPKAKTGPRGPAGPKGATGAAGATGPASVTGPAGATGPGGPQGPAGANGANGEKGEKGEPGTPGLTGYAETLPSGKTLRGQWSASGWTGTEEQHSTGVVSDAVSFPFRVENETHEGPVMHYINSKGKEINHSLEEVTPEAGCTGNAQNPGAEPGNLCVFGVVETENSILPAILCDYSVAPTPSGPTPCSVTKASPFGFVIQRIITKEGLVNNAGTWAVTAE